jgi:hypothetical protein
LAVVSDQIDERQHGDGQPGRATTLRIGHMQGGVFPQCPPRTGGRDQSQCSRKCGQRSRGSASCGPFARDWGGPGGSVIPEQIAKPGQHRIEVPRICRPARQVGRLGASERQRWGHVVYAYRHQNPALPCLFRLGSYPVGLHRIGRPHHDHGLGRVQLRLDGTIKRRAGLDLAIPPHRQASRFQRPNERLHAFPILRSVGQKDRCH